MRFFDLGQKTNKNEAFFSAELLYKWEKDGLKTNLTKRYVLQFYQATFKITLAMKISPKDHL